MAEEIERPSIGIIPKLLIGALALFGLVSLLSWVTSRVFDLARLALLVGVIVLIGLWIAGRVRGGDASD